MIETAEEPNCCAVLLQKNHETVRDLATPPSYFLRVLLSQSLTFQGKPYHRTLRSSHPIALKRDVLTLEHAEEETVADTKESVS